MVDFGFREFGKKHSPLRLDAPGLCPSCLELYIDGREGGAKTQVMEEVVDGVKTGKWICRAGGVAQRVAAAPQATVTYTGLVHAWAPSSWVTRIQ